MYSNCFITAIITGAEKSTIPLLDIWTTAYTCATHTYHFNDHFSGEPGLASFPLDFCFPFIPNLFILFCQVQISYPPSHHLTKSSSEVSCLVPSTSIVIQWLIKLVSTSCSSCPKHLNWPFFITELTGSNDNNSPSSAFLSHSAMCSTAFAVVSCLSSVCHVSKKVNISSNFF